MSVSDTIVTQLIEGTLTEVEVSFGEWLKRQRNAAGLTQEQLALNINCSTSALRKFEAELRHPSPQIVERLAEIFDIPQNERKSFLRFARGDSQAFADAQFEQAPWRAPRAATRSNLPAFTTSFIGREKEQSEIKNLILKNRLVTLTGAGGIGKTRLSIETASALLNDFPHGVWLIELAPLSDPALLPQAVVNTLGLIEQAGRSPVNILTDFLQKKRVLLILDNCEHLIEASAQLAEILLRSCPDLHILVTSREALGIDGETLYLVPTLTTPDPLHAAIQTLSDYEAVQLFLERAQTAVPGFAMTQENASAIAQVCRHLDGIPLALELAAARVKLLRVEEIAARLDDRFHLLTGGSRTVLPRHQTLQAMIDWSHDLLSDPERVLFRRLSVFTGGWTLEAAESTCADLTPGPSPERRGESAPSSVIGQRSPKQSEGEKGAGGLGSTLLDLLTSLVNKSLVIVERKQGQETRYHMLETIRQYASEKLWAAGEGEMLRERHLAYFVDLAERAEPNLRAFNMEMWLDRLETELDNIRLALESAEESDVEAQLRLATALLWFWHIRNHKNEGIEWLERGLSIEVTERGDEPLTLDQAIIRGRALNASGTLMLQVLELEKALTHFKESLALFQELGPAGTQGIAYSYLRLAGLQSGRLAEQSGSPQAESLLEQSLTLFNELGDKFGIAECVMQLTWSAQGDDNQKQAVIFAEQHLALRREIGDQDGVAVALAILGGLAFEEDEYQRAITLFEESLAIFRKLGNKWALCFGLSAFGNDFLWQGDYDRAARIFEEALVLGQDIGARFYIADSSYRLGVIAWYRGDYAQATQLITDGLAISHHFTDHELTTNSLHALGDIALACDNAESANRWYEAELRLGRQKQLEMNGIL
ncbi:MAG TPA: helix-turn-helix domain-containing protein, partial [Anaerolineales bacterium]|nr:helix-turn-helix domain-containing protein [Anaerolineales bacterium]